MSVTETRIPDLGAALASGRRALTEPEAKAVLERAGLRTPRRCFIDLQTAAPERLPFDGPYVVKAVSPALLHKSEAGGVVLNLEDAVAVGAAMDRMRGLPELAGWLVEEMVPAGIELVVGGARHPRFGPMILVGLGGIFVEVLGDVALRICPISRTDALDMLRELRAAPVLDGFRGRAGIDQEALVEVLLQVGGDDGLLMSHAAQIAELDINPLIAGPDGFTAVDARIVLSAAAEPESRAPLPDLAPLLTPNAIAVAGASTNGKAYGNQYIRHLRNFGFDGSIHPIHPWASEIDGLAACPSLAELPQPVDYAFIAVAAEHCAPLLADAGGKVRVAQVMAGGFGEGGEDEERIERETRLLSAARAGGVRVLGPNCMGTHSPAGKLTYVADPAARAGGIAVIAQSGGLSMDVIRRSKQRGLGLRAVVSVGNCLDLGAAELLPRFLEDPQTSVIGLYLEDARRGRALFEQLRGSVAGKPIALLVGGRSAQGARAALSHTGALAGDARAWDALARQCAMASAASLDDYLELLGALDGMTRGGSIPRAIREVVLFGNGGGASVLATDAFASAGMQVTPLPAATRDELLTLDLPQGASVSNPVDIPANVLQREEGRLARGIIERIFAGARPDAFVIHVNVPVILGYTHVDILRQLIAATLEARKALGVEAVIALVLRSDGEPEIEVRKRELARKAVDAGLMVFGELDVAARVLGSLGAFCEARGRLVP